MRARTMRRARRRAEKKLADRQERELRESARVVLGCECPYCMWRRFCMKQGRPDPGHDDAQAPFACKNRRTPHACRNCGHDEKLHTNARCDWCQCEKFVPLPQLVVSDRAAESVAAKLETNGLGEGATIITPENIDAFAPEAEVQ